MNRRVESLVVANVDERPDHVRARLIAEAARSGSLLEFAHNMEFGNVHHGVDVAPRNPSWPRLPAPMFIP